MDAIWSSSLAALIEISHKPYGEGRRDSCPSKSMSSNVSTAVGDMIVWLRVVLMVYSCSNTIFRVLRVCCSFNKSAMAVGPTCFALAMIGVLP